MIVEPAPQFGASGNFLAAPLSINFNNDLSHSIICEGTWQGDRKRALALHVDNYNNNFALTVTTGSSTVKVPAYSDGYVNLRGFDAVTIVSDGASTVPVFLTTQEMPTGFTARGNPPNTAVGGPLTYAASINLTPSNQAIYAAYDAPSGNVLIVTNTGLIITIDPVKYVIVSIFQTNIANNIVCACYAPDKIILCSAAGTATAYSVFTISLQSVVTLNPGGSGTAATHDITYNPNDGYFYFLRNINGAGVFRSLLNNSGSTVGTVINTANYDVSSSGTRVFYNSFDQKIYVTAGTTTQFTNQIYRYNSALVEEAFSLDGGLTSGGIMSAMCGGPNNNMYVTAYDTNNIYRVKVTPATGGQSIKKIALNSGGFSDAYNPTSGNVYCGGRDVISTGLDGVIGQMPAFVPANGAFGVCYIPSTGMTCFATGGGMVYFGK